MKVKDYLKSKYQTITIIGNTWQLTIENPISKQERKRIEDILELDVKAELELFKTKVVLYV